MVGSGVESALIVPVPAAEPAVDSWRQRLDPSCGWGIPAHITVTYPFLPPEEIDEAVVARLEDLFAPISAFGFRLESVEWFGEAVAWVRPEPAEPFRALTHLVATEWPQYPPYRGVHDEIVPHLTVCRGAAPAAMAAAAEAVAAQLPLPARADRILLMTGTPVAGSWVIRTQFLLGGA